MEKSKLKPEKLTEVELKALLVKYIATNQDRIKKWHEVHGPQVLPPIQWEENLSQYVWVNRQNRRSG